MGCVENAVTCASLAYRKKDENYTRPENVLFTEYKKNESSRERRLLDIHPCRKNRTCKTGVDQQVWPDLARTFGSLRRVVLLRNAKNSTFMRPAVCMCVYPNIYIIIIIIRFTYRNIDGFYIYKIILSHGVRLRNAPVQEFHSLGQSVNEI